jgi:phosphate transport system protein
MRKQYLQKLEDIKNDVLDLYKIVKENVGLIKKTVENQEEISKSIQRSGKLDQDVRKKTEEIEILCFELLALQSPMAKDLRFIVSVIKFLTDFERISRNALHTLEELSKFHVSEYEDYTKVILQLTDVIDFMLQEIHAAISNNTPATVRVLVESDNIIDSRYEELSTKIYEDLKNDKISMKQSLALVYISRYLERIGDHICNIGERWIYSEKGERTIIK